MNRIPRLLPCVLALIAVERADAVSFNDDIRPILADRCFACHGPDSAARKAELRLDREEVAKAALGDSGVIPIVPGVPEKSAILHRMRSHDPDEVMPPPESKLSVSKKEIALIEKWIAAGANWERHWAFLPPRSELPEAGDSTWPRNGIDEFVLAGHLAAGIEPAPPADRERLLRRVSFDLTGLPPTLAELDAFLTDGAPDAYQKAVDRLLASPAFGERMALEWLDIARYGDTDGLFEDHPRSIYPWRDWVVSAFNDNLPYSEFVRWQLAGDLLPGATNAQRIATGFLRNNPTSNEGGIIDEDYRIKYLIDRVNTTATAFLGLTMECAQCHDHKFDPMTQREYYQFAGFFNSLVGKGNTKGATAPTLRLLSPEQEQRLAALGTEIPALEKRLAENPPELLAEFESWVADLEQPIDWQTPELVSDSRPGSEKAAPAAAPKPSPVVGRLVRLALPAGRTGYITISEVEVYSGGRNVARAGVATQSSDYNGASKAGKALDGKANGSFGSCACTTEQKDAWWEVDLGADTAIDQIVVFNRNDCCPERLDHVSVTVLDAERKPVTERNIGDAPFRTEIVLNPAAPKPQAEPRDYVLTLAPAAGEIAALGFTAERPGVLDSVKVEVLAGDGKGRELKLKKTGKINFGTGEPAVVGLEAPASLADGERLRLSLVGDAVTALVTADRSAFERASVPTERDRRLAHFRSSWPGFAQQRSKLDALKKEKKDIEGGTAVSMVAADEGKPRTTHVLMRGEYDKPGDVVETAAPASIMPYRDELPRNRLGLAEWMLDPANPLTARVAVNRYWQMIFGTGLVKTSEDFGTQGERPSHRELLDHLAVEFIESGWDVKALLRRIVTSASYRQSSARPANSGDPANRLLGRGPRQRLPAEFIRDQALAVSGLLVDKRGGPGVQPYQPAVLFGRNAIGAANVSFKRGSGDDLYRRSLYTYWRRQIPAANLRILGADGRTACRTRRERTNTPLQALVVLNDPQFVEAARVLAERVMKEGGAEPADRLLHAFRLATSRRPNEAELGILLQEYRERLTEFREQPDRAKAYLSGGGERKADPALDPVELASYAAVSSLILNLDESLSKS